MFEKHLQLPFGFLGIKGLECILVKEENPFLLQSPCEWVGKWVGSFSHPSKAKRSMRTLL